MAKRAAVLGVHLIAPDGSPVRVGALTRDASGATAFLVDEAYLRDDQRPVLSLRWVEPGDPQGGRARLADRGDKIGLHGFLPPWFAGLLPEGALRALVNTEMGPGDHDAFDLITRLGADLPGAVLVIPDNAEAPGDGEAFSWANVSGFKAPVPDGVVKFSLAGVQLKFAAVADGDRFTAPARAGEGRYILKLASEQHRDLPEVEYSAMTLARHLGVNTADCRLTPTATIADIPPAFLIGENALVVRRFDRPAGDKRVHIEDAAQIIGATGERKYTMANTETVLNMISRFSSDRAADVLEGMRRIVADVLLGNGDNHLKNWSFIFPAPGQIRLSPAYDIVPTVLYIPRDMLALPFAGTARFEAIRLRRFRRVASHLGLNPDWIEKEVRAMVRSALETWPRLMADLPLTEAQRDQLIHRWDTLDLVTEVREAPAFTLSSSAAGKVSPR